MTSADFHARAVAWLRTSQNLSTTVRPGERLEEGPAGGAHVSGFVTRSSSAGRWAFGGLCALALGTVLTMFNLPGVSEETRSTIWRAGHASQAVSAGCFVVAEIERRRNRTRVVVELRATGDPATLDSVIALHGAAKGTTAWLVTERELPPDVRAAAAGHGVRCFVPRGNEFRETVGAPAEPLDCEDA